ncbi:MAG: ABC transporter permease, partial [Proteobacteria bacterium]|nr:ABC transporter permease [Pseudomonadota bacterium]
MALSALRIKHIVRKEFIQVFRDKRARILLFLPPLIQLMIFGYAVNMDITNIRLGIMDLSHSQQSRELIASFMASKYFRIVRMIEHEKQIRELLDHGAVQGVLKINRDFAKKVKREEDTAVQLILDGTDSNTAHLIAQYVASIVRQYSRGLVRDRIDRQLSRQLMAGNADELRGVGEVVLQQRAWFNPNL